MMRAENFMSMFAQRATEKKFHFAKFQIYNEQ